jgi:hypothetical protein
VGLAAENRLEDNSSDQYRGGRKVKCEERFRLIQETQEDMPVGELNRGLQVLGYVLRQNRGSHSEFLTSSMDY